MDYDRLRELQQKFEENPRRYFAPLANEYRKGGQPRRAIEIYKVQLEQMPGHMSGQIVYGQALYEAGDFVEARKVFERALSLDPENLIALRSLGDMSLQAGSTQEARTWYSRLLDADPKDTAVIALISEIDAAAEGKPVAAKVPGIDTDVGDQQIPAAMTSGEQAAPIPEPALLDGNDAPESTARSEQPQGLTDDYPPLGLERHYPVQEAAQSSTEPPAREGKNPDVEAAVSEGPSFEDLGVPAGGSAAEGLTSAREDVNSALDSQAAVAETSDELKHSSADMERRVEGLETTNIGQSADQPRLAEPGIAESANQSQPAQSVAGRSHEQSSPAESAVANSAEPAPAAESVAASSAGGERQAAAPAEERQVTAASTEPFVNETMAKLYLKQGYNQLALKVYRQLLVARPNDQSLRDRIREIQEADAAQHPGETVVQRDVEPAIRAEQENRAPRPEPVEARREAPEPMDEPSEETPVEPQVPRSPSIETPTPTAPDADDGFNYGGTPADSPPDYEPSRERESIEAPTRDEPRAEPGGFAARQPSIREFFATLGRRRPPRASFGATSRPVAQAPMETPADTPQQFSATPPAANLDSVFAGATVSPADARAASRLAGAFSGASGASRTPPTPPMPTPRLNPRVQAQESEEDVAKFRAWLDGLTGE